VNPQIAGFLGPIALKAIESVLDHSQRLVQAERLGQVVEGGNDVEALSVPLQPIEKIESASFRKPGVQKHHSGPVFRVSGRGNCDVGKDWFSRAMDGIADHVYPSREEGEIPSRVIPAKWGLPHPYIFNLEYIEPQQVKPMLFCRGLKPRLPSSSPDWPDRMKVAGAFMPRRS
jgi:hypothetical protein